MNEKSKKIVKDKFKNVQPIYKRAKNEIEARNINLNFLKQMYRDNNNKQDQNVHNIIKPPKKPKKQKS